MVHGKWDRNRNIPTVAVLMTTLNKLTSVRKAKDLRREDMDTGLAGRLIEQLEEARERERLRDTTRNLDGTIREVRP